MLPLFSLAQRFWCSTIGKKIIVALTGLVLVGFLAGHLTGNLLIFGGAEALNQYALWLHSHPYLVWFARVGLLISFVVHIVATISLVMLKRAARPEGYALHRPQVSRAASRWMIVSGTIILAFVFIHLQHFTVRLGLAEKASYYSKDDMHGQGMADVYRMAVLSFQSWWISLFYIVAIAMLCWHLSHGIASVFQTLGLNSKRTRPLTVGLGWIISAVYMLGYCSIPVAVFFGFIK